MPEQTSLIFQGLDRASPAVQADPGACRVLEGAVRPAGRRGWVPAKEAANTGPTGLQSIARQSQEEGARLVAIRSASPDELVAVDVPGGSETSLGTLSGSDNTREIQAATVTRDTVLGVTSGAGIGSPESLRLLRGDTITELPWPQPPTFSVQWHERTDENYIEGGTYVIRLAWRLEDGTVGPASGPLLTTTPNTSDDTRWTCEITVDGYPGGQPAGGWADRVEGLTIIAHPEAATTSATDVNAPDVPGFRVSGWDAVPAVGDTTTWHASLEGIISSETYDTQTLIHHDLTAGALFTFNKRLVMGDVAYDYEKPLLEYMVDGADGGTDFHLTMQVAIETAQGTIIRYADPLGFSSSAAQTASFRQNMIFYRDSRARSWRWLVSDNYTGDFDAATWTEVNIQGAPTELHSAANANFSYVEPLRDSINLSLSGVSDADVSNASEWTDDVEGILIAEADPDNPNNYPAAPPPETHDAALDVQQYYLGANETLSLARFRVEAEVREIAYSGGDGNGLAEVTVSVEDGANNTLDSQTVEYNLAVEDESGYVLEVVELQDFDAAAAEFVRVEINLVATADANGGYCRITSQVQTTPITLEINDDTVGDTISVDRSTAHAERDRDGNRLVWSEPLRPLDLPAANVAFVGEGEDDPIMGLSSTAQPVSEGQYGDYPLLVLCRHSIWGAQAADDPFIQGVSPITADMGIVGRSAYVNANGPIIAATGRGVVELTPNLERYLSTSLHDETFLSALGPDTLANFFTSEDGRREVWVDDGSDTYIFSIADEAWSSLPVSRSDRQRVDDDLYGVNGGALVQEGAASATHTVTIETAPAFLEAPSALKRLRDAWLQQGAPVPDGNTQFLHVRSVADVAVGVDYTTDVSEPLRLHRGVVPAMSVWLRIDASTSVSLIGVGVRYDLRNRSTPRATVSDDGELLGASATQTDLDSDVDW